MWTNVRAAARDALSTPAWWKQQAWIITTEVLMGFLAAWGLMRAVPPWAIGLGLGVVYATSALALWGMRVHGRRAGFLVVATALAVLVGFTWSGGLWRWMGLCVSIGVLLAFRDNQSVHALAWLPVRAARRKANTLTHLTVAAVLSALALALALWLSGWISQWWKWLPHALVLLAFGCFVPEMLWRMGRSGSPSKVPAHWRISHRHHVSWLLKLGVAFNAVNFLGRRLVIPALIVSLANAYGHGDRVLPILGGVLGFVGVVGSLARVPMMATGKMPAMTLLKWGARLSLLGWAMLCAGLLAQTAHALPYPWVLVPIVVGWGMLEITNRTWSIAYMEQLRVFTVGPRFSAARAHRRSLHRFMVRKSTGGAVGCALGGVVAPALAPAVVLLLVVGCWAVLERHPDGPS